jgi:hypothetical protein
VKLLRCPQAMVSAQSNHIKSDSTNDVTSIQVTGKEEHDKRIQQKVWCDILRIDDD